MISIITVNYNNARATTGLLDALSAQTDRDFDVYVVDNHSEPDDRGLLGRYASVSSLSVDLLLSDSNRGFSGGNNLAIRKAREQGSTWMLLINNDTTVPPDFIERLRPHLEHEPAVIGIPLREDGRVAYAGIVRWLKPTLPHTHSAQEREAYRTRECRLYAIGGGVAIHRDVFSRVGMLDERYFLYFEDADYSLRACRAGVPVRFLDAPVIDHAVSLSTSRLGSPALLYYHARNALLFNRTHGPWWIRILLPFAAFYGMFRQILKIVLLPSRRAVSRAVRDGIIDFYARRFGPLTRRYHDRS